MKRLLLLALLLVGCGSSQRTSDAMRAWVGHSEHELVAQWGPPQHVYRMEDGSRVLTYTRTSGAAHSYNDGEGNSYHYAADVSTRDFTVDAAGMIVAWRWHGN